MVGTNELVHVSFSGLPNDVSRGTHILIDDGLIDMVVVSTTRTEIACTVINGGTISSSKGINVPGVQLSLPFISSRDRAGKQVITATQMLDSMIKNPRPTRAEATDVANAIYDGTSAIMLSGETAAGAYPVEAVKTMARIAERTESDINYRKRFMQASVPELCNVTDAISHATCAAAHDLNAAAVITVTKSGMTGRMISKFRPLVPIIGCSPSEKVLRQMNLSWGVTPIYVEEKKSTDELFEAAVSAARQAGAIKDGDLTVITAGVPLGKSGTTNVNQP